MAQRIGDSTQPISARQIREHYLGVSDTNRTPIPPLEHLTPSAKFVVEQARQFLEKTYDKESNEYPSDRELRAVIERVLHQHGEQLSSGEQCAALAALSASLTDFDLLSPLVENGKINDIVVRSYNDVSVQIGRTNVQTDLAFASHESYLSYLENLLIRAGKACTLASPVVDVSVSPTVRACITHQSFSPPGSGPMLTLRVSRYADVSLQHLSYVGLAPMSILTYLAAVVRAGTATLLIAGEVGTGKTTLVRALAREIAEDQAVLIIEDTHEIVLDRAFTRTLLTREANTEGAGTITPAQAIRAGMRMAMNRIILGELRDAKAAEAFIDVCASGHAGMSTIHARSARDALRRLELFLSRAQPGVATSTIRRQISNAVSVVVYLGESSSDRERRIRQIFEVDTSTDREIQVSPIFSYYEENSTQETPCWKRESGITQFAKVLRNEGVELLAANQELSFSTDVKESEPSERTICL